MPRPERLSEEEQRVLLCDEALSRAVELGYVREGTTRSDWEKIVMAGTKGFDKILRLREGLLR